MSGADDAYLRERAEREIALAKAAGATRAYASADNRVVFIERRDGTKERVRMPERNQPR